MARNSVLEYALLGLLHAQPLSGYDLRKIFASTPIGGFSDSPGAIYPALGRLEARNLIRGAVQKSTGLRQRRMFRVTPQGLASLQAWQTQAIVREDIVRHVDELLLRFAFMDRTLGPKRSVVFLREFAKELSGHIPSLREHFDAHANQMPLSGRLALQIGIQEYEARLDWARKSIPRYTRAKKKRL